MEGWKTDGLSARIRGFDDPFGNCIPYLRAWDILLGPGDSEKGGIPADHGRRFFISRYEILESR
jgi:hypothetical protein